jgi:DNA repair exonuclease SbcCD nuclease subunit
MMKLVAFADLHLDSAFAWAGAGGPLARRRRDALRETLRRIVQLARDGRADALLCAGDLYEHERPSPDIETFLRKTFADLHPIRVFLAPGNHDWYGPQSHYRRIAWTDNVYVFQNSRLTPVTLADGVTLWGAAHCAPSGTPGFLSEFSVDRQGIHLGLFHGSERSWMTEQSEGREPHAPFDGEEIKRAGLHHAFVGHYHRPRDADTHTYPGNPDPLAFGEDGERGAVVVTVMRDGAIRRQRHSVAVTQVHDLEVDLTGCCSRQEVRDRVAAAADGKSGIARVTLSGELAPELDLKPAELEDVAPSLERLRIRVGAMRPGYDLDTIALEPTVRGQFVRDVRSADLQEDTRRRVLLTGLRALDGRDDLEVL